MPDIQGNGKDRPRHNQQICPKLLGTEDLPEAADQQEVVKIEVDAEEQHKDANHNIKIDVVIGPHAQIPIAEAACARGAERMNAGIKQRHPSQKQQDDLNHRHSQINAIEDFCSVAHTAHQLAHRRPRHFRPKQMHSMSVGHRQHGHHEHQHAHAADPMGKAAPKENTLPQRFHRGQDGGPGGGEAGDRLKESVDKIRNIPGNHKRQRAEQRHTHPSQRHHREAVPGIKGGLFRLPAKNQARQTQSQHWQQERRQGFPVQGRHQKGQQQQNALRPEDAADDVADHFIIQRSVPLTAKYRECPEGKCP